MMRRCCLVPAGATSAPIYALPIGSLRALAATERLERDISVLAAVQASPDWHAAGPDLRRLVHHLLNSTLEQEYGGPARLLSAWYGQEAEALGGADMLFPGGFDQIPGPLAKGLDSPV